MKDIKKRFLFWVLILSLPPIVGFILLQLVGRFFVSELTQEVSLQDVRAPQGGTTTENTETPYFELPDLSGNIVKLSDFSGTPLVVTFWTTWNSSAADQLRIFDDYLTANKSTPFTLLTINSQEDRSIVATFMRRGGYNVKVLLDEKGIVTEVYQARNLPTTYFIDVQGFIKDRFVGALSIDMLLEKSAKLIP